MVKGHDPAAAMLVDQLKNNFPGKRFRFLRIAQDKAFILETDASVRFSVSKFCALLSKFFVPYAYEEKLLLTTLKQTCFSKNAIFNRRMGRRGI